MGAQRHQEYALAWPVLARPDRRDALYVSAPFISVTYTVGYRGPSVLHTSLQSA